MFNSISDLNAKTSILDAIINNTNYIKKFRLLAQYINSPFIFNNVYINNLIIISNVKLNLYIFHYLKNS